MTEKTQRVQRFFDACAEEWDSVSRSDPEKIAYILSKAHIRPGARVLDVACGTGVLTQAILQLGPAQVTGVDLSEKMIARAKEKFTDARAVFIVADIQELCCDTPYDTVLLYNAYPHFEDKEALFQAVSRLTRPGGCFVLAHGEGRGHINRCHLKSPGRQEISSPLGPAEEMALLLKPWFDVDLLEDSDGRYLVRGFKKN
ncbi:MAG: class I SAM-dependent methyltransferase [Oscillospiraceae bacterium]|nr:class I SAM-dependent methyltransferase [Oscillospiraceae bacterium]